MSLEIDHVFVCTDDAPEGERVLADFGLRFGRYAVHDGQGTANACACFDNAYLELLWRRDADELQSERVRPLGLWERIRWRHTGASPFGIGFRASDDAAALETWPYEAAYRPEPIPIVTPRDAWHEPLLFLAPSSGAP